jgi:lantibiotic modifying enzyme
LLSLADASGQERFQQAALEAFAYERSLFSPEKQTWLMPPADKATRAQRTRMTWNQGAPGIALSRIASLRYIDEPLIRDEIDIALERTIIEGFDQSPEDSHANHSLSHGYFGNLETLLAATQVEPSYGEHLDRYTAMLLDSITAHGWVTAAPLNVETPGLMVGLAGIGYELLRLAEPERVPSVLLLAPPYLAQPPQKSANHLASSFV